MNRIEFQIGDAKRGFSLGLGFLGRIIAHFDTDLIGFGNLMAKNPFLVTPAILFESHKIDCEINGQPVDFTIHDVSEWVEGLEGTINNGKIENLLIMLMDSINAHLPKKEVDEDKKKAKE